MYNITNILLFLESPQLSFIHGDLIKNLNWFQVFHIYIQIKSQSLKAYLKEQLLKYEINVWTLISKVKNTPDVFLEEFSHKMNWKLVSKHHHIENPFLKKFVHFLDFYIIRQRYNIPKDILLHYLKIKRQKN